MHVGMSTIFQNPHNQRSDHDVYADELRLADLAEPLGFESIWGVEPHFTDYTMCPDVLQFRHAGAAPSGERNAGYEASDDGARELTISSS